VLSDPKDFKILKEKTMKDKTSNSSLKQRNRVLKRLFSFDMETDFKEWNEEKKIITKARVKAVVKEIHNFNP
jgi:hypothetical protein